MKLIKFVIVFIIIFNPLIFSPLTAQTNIKSGLYIGAELKGNFAPYLDGGGQLTLFYRFISDVFPGYIWEGIKTDVGISDYMTAENNKLTIFADTSIIEYVNINAKLSFLNYYTFGQRGFVSFASSNQSFSTNEIENANKTENISFEAEITPTFKFEFLKNMFEGRGIVLQAGLTFKYAYIKYGKYHLDYDLLLIRDQNDISYKLDTLLIANLYPMSVGLNYMLAYMNNTKQLWQSIGAYAHLEWELLNRIYMEANLKIGEYISHPAFKKNLYADMNAMITFRII